MKLSVALCTFNGERHLSQQLDSIRNQTRRPDEVVICDDASMDLTREIAQRFARSVRFSVRLESNSATMGSTCNFARAIGLCCGDVIVLADQDDLWLPHRLAAIETAFRDAPESAFAFSDAQVVDAELNSLGYRLWDALQFRRRERLRFESGRGFEVLLRRHRVTGATMAFRARYRDLVLPIPSGWVHDAWIALILSSVAPCALIEEPLILYRQHAAQQHGGRKRSLVEQYRAACRLTGNECEAVARRFEEAWDRLRGMPGVPADRLALLREKIEHHRRRAAMREPERWRLPRVVKEAIRGRYSRFGQGWKTMAQDLALG